MAIKRMGQEDIATRLVANGFNSINTIKLKHIVLIGLIVVLIELIFYNITKRR